MADREVPNTDARRLTVRLPEQIREPAADLLRQDDPCWAMGTTSASLIEGKPLPGVR
jgi:hypothetical protein